MAYKLIGPYTKQTTVTNVPSADRLEKEKEEN